MGALIAFGFGDAPSSQEAPWGQVSQKYCSSFVRDVPLPTVCSYVSSVNISHLGLFSMGKTKKWYFWDAA